SRSIAHTRFTGFAMPEFIVDGATGAAYLLEFNPRPAPQTHLPAEVIGVDLCRAWHAHIAGESPPKLAGPIIGRTVAMFPQEWLRDPDSAHLRPENAVQDVPNDDPRLLQAFLTLKG